MASAGRITPAAIARNSCDSRPDRADGRRAAYFRAFIRRPPRRRPVAASRGQRRGAEILGAELCREDLPGFPELSEPQVLRHFLRLSQLNFAQALQFYPLGSCTMKYNPVVNDEMAALPGFAALHPLTPAHLAQGALELMARMEAALAEITGMDAVSLHPAAGAQGELTGLLMVRAYHRKRGEAAAQGDHPRHRARHQSCQLHAGGLRGDRRELEQARLSGSGRSSPAGRRRCGRDDGHQSEHARNLRAGNPGYRRRAARARRAALSRRREHERAAGCREAGTHGRATSCSSNLHKTFSTPHGGGGPGAGPIAVKQHLEPFLPLPRLKRDDGGLRFDGERPDSIGRLRSFYGNFGMLVRAYAYILALGGDGLADVEPARDPQRELRAQAARSRISPAPRPSPRCMNACSRTTSKSGRRSARSKSRSACSTSASIRRRSIFRWWCPAR